MILLSLPPTTSALLPLALALLVGPAVAAPAPRASTALLPLSDADMGSTHESGCQFAFDGGERTYIFIINRNFLIRTAPGRGGLRTCRINEAQYTNFGDGRTRVTCAGRTMLVRPAGPARGYPEADSVVFPATLRIEAKGAPPRTMRGEFGSAC